MIVVTVPVPLGIHASNMSLDGSAFCYPARDLKFQAYGKAKRRTTRDMKRNMAVDTFHCRVESALESHIFNLHHLDSFRKGGICTIEEGIGALL